MTNEWWLNQDKKKVNIDGIAYRLHVRVFDSVYPYSHERLSVYAEPINKNTKYYQKIRKDLCDDWNTDVLSSVEFENAVITQLQG